MTLLRASVVWEIEGGLKPLEATSYVTAAGHKKALRSKRLEPGYKLETRSQGINKSQKAHRRPIRGGGGGDSQRKYEQMELI